MALALTVSADVEPPYQVEAPFEIVGTTSRVSDKNFVEESPADSGRQSCSSSTSSIFRFPISSEDEFSSTLSVDDLKGSETVEKVLILECVEPSPVQTPSVASAQTFHRSFSFSDIVSFLPTHGVSVHQRHRSTSIPVTPTASPPPASEIPAPPPPPPLPQTQPSAAAHSGPLIEENDPMLDMDIFMDLDFAVDDFPSHGSCMLCGDEVFGFFGKMQCCNEWICESCVLGHTLQHSNTNNSIPCPNSACKSHKRSDVHDDVKPDIGPVSECIVCYCEIRRRARNKCKRKCCSEMVCKNCMTEIIRTNIESEGQVHIQCPNPECDGVVTREEILSHANDSTKNKYERLRMNQSVSKNRKTCPNCCEMTEHQLPRRLWHYKEEDIHITCKKCSHEWCFNCHAPWHQGVKCREFQKGDKQFKKWTKSSKNGTPNCQKCPLCRVNIQKSQGCNHMTCNRCSTNFCYRCGGFYNLEIPGLGGHHNRISIFGCKYNYKENEPVKRKAIRGGYFGAKMAMLTGYPVLFVAGAAILLVGGAVVLPIYGIYRYRKYRKNLRRVHRPRRH